MLELINLSIINSIIKEFDIPREGNMQIVYIRILIYHFKDLPVSLKNSESFSLPKSKLKFDIPANNSLFKEMRKKNLIKISKNEVLFFDVWNKYIVFPNNKTPKMFYINEFKDRIFNDSAIKTFVSSKFEMNLDKVEIYLKSFVLRSEAISSNYHEYSGCCNHFISYVKLQINEKKLNKSLNVDTPVSKTVSASSKRILGME